MVHQHIKAMFPGRGVLLKLALLSNLLAENLERGMNPCRKSLPAFCPEIRSKDLKSMELPTTAALGNADIRKSAGKLNEWIRRVNPSFLLVPRVSCLPDELGGSGLILVLEYEWRVLDACACSVYIVGEGHRVEKGPRL